MTKSTPTPFDGDTEFYDQTYTGLECRGLALAGKEFTGCTFVGSSFAGAAFTRAKLIECTFRGCDLSNVTLKGATLREVTFEDSKLLGVNWTETVAATFLTFRGAVVSLGNFTGMDLRRLKLERCTARDVEFAHANLSEADCRGTDFAGSRFLQTNLTKADLRGAHSYAIRANDNTLKQAKFAMPDAMALLYGLDIVLEP